MTCRGSCCFDPKNYVRPASYSDAERVAECKLLEAAAQRQERLDRVAIIAERSRLGSTSPVLVWTREAAR